MLDTPLAKVPTLSLADQGRDPDRFAEDLGGSFRRFGFAIVADHGIPQDLIARAWAETEALFALPDAEKRSYFVEGAGGARGYTPFKTEIIAVNFKGYPSLEAFRARWRLMRSYERMIADETTDAALASHAQEFRGFFGNGSVQVDVIQFLARDPLNVASYQALARGWRKASKGDAHHQAVQVLSCLKAAKDARKKK